MYCMDTYVIMLSGWHDDMKCHRLLGSLHTEILTDGFSISSFMIWWDEEVASYRFILKKFDIDIIGSKE